MQRRTILGSSLVALTVGFAGCLDGTDLRSGETDEAISAVEAFYDGVVADDEATIEATYLGDLTRVRQEVGVGIVQLGVGYQDVTAVDIQRIETASTEDLLSYRTESKGDDLAQEVDRWEEGLPQYVEDLGATDYEFVTIQAAIEVFGETELETDFLLVVEVDGDWFVTDMPSSNDIALFDVGMNAMSFDPAQLTVEAGSEVVWRNTAARIHTVTATSVPDDASFFTSGGFESYEEAETAYLDDRAGSLQTSEEFAHTFEVPGTYEYQSIPFGEEASGTVIVEDPE